MIPPPEPGELLDMALGQESFEQVSRATALAQIIGVASHLECESGIAAQDLVLDRYRTLIKDRPAGLMEEARHSQPLGIALRHLVIALVRRGDLSQAEAIAVAIPHDAQRISARLVIANRLAHGTPQELAIARHLEEIEEQIARTLGRRLDRSPRLAESTAIWASLGETERGIDVRQDCRLADRLQADTLLLAGFAAPGAPAAIGLPDLFEPPPVFANGGVRMPTPPLVLRPPQPRRPSTPIPP